MGKVVVLLSTYNGQKYLATQLNSIERQDYRDIELIVRDDGSTDNTRSILSEFQQTTSIPMQVIYGKNVGPAAAFWSLLKDGNISADYFAFCDQDDVWATDKVSTAVQVLQKDNQNVLYFSNCRVIDADGEVINSRMRNDDPQISFKRLFISGVTQGCSMVLTQRLRDYLCKSSISSLPMHDLITMLYALSLGKIVYDQFPRFDYRSHSGNVVEKQNKTIFGKAITSLRTLRNNQKNPLDLVAKELLINDNSLSATDKATLRSVRDYKKSVSAFFKVLAFSSPDVSKKAMRSFRVRVLLRSL